MWELYYIESWALKNWCFWTVMLEKTLESPLDCQEIQPVHAKGNQPLVFIRRTDAGAETPILWSSYVKRWLIWKDPDARKDWGQQEKGMTEAEMVWWNHQLNGLSLGKPCNLVMDREAWCATVHGVEKSRTRLRDWTELNWCFFVNWGIFIVFSSVTQSCLIICYPTNCSTLGLPVHR